MRADGQKGADGVGAGSDLGVHSTPSLAVKLQETPLRMTSFSGDGRERPGTLRRTSFWGAREERMSVAGRGKRGWDQESAIGPVFRAV
jgi:hypothetical protein